MMYNNTEELYVFKNFVCTNIGNLYSFITNNFTYFKAETPNQNALFLDWTNITRPTIIITLDLPKYNFYQNLSSDLK